VHQQIAGRFETLAAAFALMESGWRDCLQRLALVNPDVCRELVEASELKVTGTHPLLLVLVLSQECAERLRAWEAFKDHIALAASRLVAVLMLTWWAHVYL
jgi:hypothetical protein